MNDLETSEIIQAISDLNPSFLVINGDLTFEASNEAHRQYFDYLMQPLQKKSIPVFPNMGNHEYTGNHEKAIDHLSLRFPGLLS